MRHFIAMILLVAGALAGSARAHAQDRVRFVTGLTAGGTYYCIVTRCNTGQTVGALAEVQVAPALALELAARRHGCFDCDRFFIADAALVLRYPARIVQPFFAAGVARSSDPEFMGTQLGLMGAAGAWAWFQPAWGAKLELRGRQVGRGDGMGELSVALGYRFGP